jgi:hypothetical protein
MRKFLKASAAGPWQLGRAPTLRVWQLRTVAAERRWRIDVREGPEQEWLAAKV